MSYLSEIFAMPDALLSQMNLFQMEMHPTLQIFQTLPQNQTIVLAII